ncbi:M13 family metallopeptidase [Corynebacterium mendelii]|uniref:Peptidase M13 n=1 Tax=Corynebacterium mendelii TaxID=2765362 RepID=A0A939E0Y2_9CORY|nr:M13-type metalloendopeptidase [Corynebacterium mendelii]MBN9644426.1 peptidase M13 [Corynebacterium mendelii]
MRDLFRYMNGPWLDSHDIPADRAVDGMFHKLRDKSEEDVHEIVKKDTGRAGVLFRSFMDTDAIEKAGTTPIRGDLDEVAAISTVEELLTVIGRFDRAGFGSPIGFYVVKTPDSEQAAPFLVQSGLGLPDEAYYREDAHADTLATYEKHVATMLGFIDSAYLLGHSPAEAARMIVELEKKIAAGHWDVVASRDAVKTFNPMEFSELPTSAQKILRAAGLPEARVINQQPSFVTHLDCLFTDDLVPSWKLYLFWHVLSSVTGLLPDEITEANFDFYGRELSGAEELRDRWKRGLQLVEGAVGEELGKPYVAEHFPPSHKQEMVELVQWLTKAYHERISKLQWMTPETRERALEKLSKFRAKIGYPDTWRDFTGLEFTEGGAHLIDNYKAAAAFNHDYEISKAGKPADRDEWHCTPQTVNAFYNPVVNDITFPAAILQWPFYDPTADAAENFGAIGAVIGHEIGHGFDDQGSQYDGVGNLNSWWTDEDRKAFEELTGKLVNQYQGLVPTVLKENGIESAGVNGQFTLGENIGDLGGLGIAVVAYRMYLEDKGLDFDSAPVTTTDADGADPEVEGKQFTALQRMFLAWARVWRTAIRPQMATQYLAIDPHSPAEFRCNVIAANIDEFYSAFEVDKDSIMWIDPKDRVTIW